jgi:hypothetical protein
MCLWRAPEKYIAGAALDRAGIDVQLVYAFPSSGETLQTVTILTRARHYSTEPDKSNHPGTHFFKAYFSVILLIRHPIA